MSLPSVVTIIKYFLRGKFQILCKCLEDCRLDETGKLLRSKLPVAMAFKFLLEALLHQGFSNPTSHLRDIGIQMTVEVRADGISFESDYLLLPRSLSNLLLYFLFVIFSLFTDYFFSNRYIFRIINGSRETIDYRNFFLFLLFDFFNYVVFVIDII